MFIMFFCSFFSCCIFLANKLHFFFPESPCSKNLFKRCIKKYNQILEDSVLIAIFFTKFAFFVALCMLLLFCWEKFFVEKSANDVKRAPCCLKYNAAWWKHPYFEIQPPRPPTWGGGSPTSSLAWCNIRRPPLFLPQIHTHQSSLMQSTRRWSAFQRKFLPAIISIALLWRLPEVCFNLPFRAVRFLHPASTTTLALYTLAPRRWN